MKIKEWREMETDELQRRLDEAYQELLNLRFRAATKQLEDTSRIRIVRRDIARIKTVLRERQLASVEGGRP
ncbi:MAG: 50S ribosomal protein L29 [Chloroflexi bacterium]|nr:50S ribosomal protein L29 [Chloroflexota bacterium]